MFIAYNILLWSSSFDSKKEIPSNSGLVSINGVTIYLNLILGQVIFISLSRRHYPNPKLLCVIYTDKLNGKNALDLYTYLVLLKRKIYIENTICTQEKINNCLRNDSSYMKVSK